MAERDRTVKDERTTRTVRPANLGLRLGVAIPMALAGLALAVLGALSDGMPDGLRVALVVCGLALAAGFGYVAAGALGVGSGGTDGSMPDAKFGHTETIRTHTETIEETGLPAEGRMPPKHGDMPPKD